jgi:hypothetical protein
VSRVWLVGEVGELIVWDVLLPLEDLELFSDDVVCFSPGVVG